jgi:hypothetical protein
MAVVSEKWRKKTPEGRRQSGIDELESIANRHCSPSLYWG